MTTKNEEINYINSKEDSSLQIAREDEDFIQSRISKFEKEKNINSDSQKISEPKGSLNKNINTKNLNNLLLSCVKNQEYCYTMLDYMKKMFHFSQVDYYLAYTQILYCFKPKEM
jgi:hypothetical protein